MAERIRFDDLDGEVEEAPGLVSSFVAGAAQGGTFNLGDEMEGAQQGTAAALLGAGSAALRGDWEGVTQAPKLGLETYRAVRDGRRAENRVREAANPTSYGTGQFAGAVGSGVATGGLGAGLRGAIAVGAGEGALSGLGGNEDDLTFQDAEAYARAFRDTLEGGGAGAAGGGIGYGVGKGLQWMGGKARNALGRARGELAEEARAGLDAEADALRAADDAAEARMGKEQGRALEMNKAVDARAAREEAKRVAKEAREAARAQRAAAPRSRRGAVDPNEDPDTKVLGGYARGARKLRKDNAREVLDARARMQAEDITPEERLELEEYLALHGDAVDAPLAFRLRTVEEGLRKRGYSPEVVQRAMARLDARGNAVSRRNMPPPEAPETTQIQDAGDWARRGQYERAGGGGSAFGDEFASAPTRVDAEMRPGFNDADTRVGLVRLTPPEGVPNQDNGRAMHRFRFIHPETRKEFDLVAHASPADKDTIVVDGVGEAGRDFVEAWQQNANGFGPGVMRQMFRELGEAFPGRSRIGGWRATGANPNRGMNFRAPSTVAEPTPRYAFPGRAAAPAPRASGDFEAVLRDRNLDAMPLEGRRATARWDESTQTQVEGMPAIPAGARRLYRGEAEAARESLGDPGADAVAGGWYTDRLGVADDYAARAARETGTPGRVRFVDLPEDDARAFRSDRLPEGRYSDEAPREWVLPEEAQRGARTVPEEARLPPAVGEEGSPGYVPFWARGSEEALDGNRFLDPARVRADEATGLVRGFGEETQSMDLGDVVRQGRVGIGGGGPSAFGDMFAEAPTRVDPAMQDATRATVVPEVRRGAMRPPMAEAPAPTQVGQPAAFTERTRYAPPDMAQRLAGRPEVDARVAERLAGGGRDIRNAFVRGASGEGAVGYGLAGVALDGFSGGVAGLALRGGAGAVREMLKNPAARARAITAFKLDRLARVNPAAWGRVSATLTRAAQQDEAEGTDVHLKAARHVLLQRDAEFRAADAAVAEELQNLDEDALARRLSAR